jgi:acetoin utilization protein AcuB
MTLVPRSIGYDRPLQQALDQMREFRIRHLPVLKGGELVGILTDRDINLVLTLKDTDAESTTVEEAYTPDPYFTSPTAPLNEVAAHMAGKKYGCALVVDNGKLVGIFTETDALRALSEVLESRHRD